MNYHVYGIQHNITTNTSNCSPDTPKETLQPFKQPTDRLKENLLVLNQFFAENPIDANAAQNNQPIQRIPNRPVAVLRQAPPQPRISDENNPKVMYLNLSSFKKKSPNPQPQQLPYFQQKGSSLSNLLLKIKHQDAPQRLIRPTNSLEQTRQSKDIVVRERILSNRQHDWLDMNVIERNERWNQLKNEKREVKKMQLLEDELNECTFKPQTSKKRVNRSETGLPMKSPMGFPSPNSNESCMFGYKDLTSHTNKGLLKQQVHKSSHNFRPISYSEIFRSRQELSRIKGYNDQLINFGF